MRFADYLAIEEGFWDDYDIPMNERRALFPDSVMRLVGDAYSDERHEEERATLARLAEAVGYRFKRKGFRYEGIAYRMLVAETPAGEVCIGERAPRNYALCDRWYITLSDADGESVASVPLRGWGWIREAAAFIDVFCGHIGLQRQLVAVPHE